MNCWNRRCMPCISCSIHSLTPLIRVTLIPILLDSWVKGDSRLPIVLLCLSKSQCLKKPKQTKTSAHESLIERDTKRHFSPQPGSYLVLMWLQISPLSAYQAVHIVSAPISSINDICLWLCNDPNQVLLLHLQNSFYINQQLIQHFRKQ